MDEHGHVEDGEDEVGAPLDVGKGLGDEQAESGVEGPVEGRAESDTLATEAEREELGRVGPGDGTPGGCERCDEEVGAGNETLGGRAGDTHGLSGHSLDTARHDLTMNGENTSVGEHPGAHEDGTHQKSWSTTPAVHPDQGGDGGEDVDDVVDGGGQEIGIATVSGHGEDVGNVVHW